MRRLSERGARNCHQRNIRKVWTIYINIENVYMKMFLYDSDKIKIRLPFYRSFSTFWNIIGGLCTQVFMHRHGVRSEWNSFVS